MLLLNENRQQLDVEQLKKNLVNGIKEDHSSQADIEKALSDYYAQAYASEAKEYKFEPAALQSQSFLDIGKKIFAKIQHFICGVLTSGSNATQIVDVVLKSLSSIIPGGVIVEFIVQKVVNYIVGIGVDKLCAVPQA
ncbi:MAG TPA: hypothetical protein VK559_12320 [Ferruginibacter sp.]|nr:hypothetical protein [Ferruginibacter sp.]